MAPEALAADLLERAQATDDPATVKALVAAARALLGDMDTRTRGAS